MGFYSFVVWSPGEIPLPTVKVVLERGSNTFNATIDDIESFRFSLLGEDVRIIKECRLDTFETVPPEMALGQLPTTTGFVLPSEEELHVEDVEDDSSRPS
jgi:hypothetical protein